MSFQRGHSLAATASLRERTERSPVLIAPEQGCRCPGCKKNNMRVTKLPGMGKACQSGRAQISAALSHAGDSLCSAYCPVPESPRCGCGATPLFAIAQPPAVVVRPRDDARRAMRSPLVACLAANPYRDSPQIAQSPRSPTPALLTLSSIVSAYLTALLASKLARCRSARVTARVAHVA